MTENLLPYASGFEQNVSDWWDYDSNEAGPSTEYAYDGSYSMEAIPTTGIIATYTDSWETGPEEHKLGAYVYIYTEESQFGTRRSGADLIFGYKDSDNYYKANITASRLGLYEVVSGSSAELAKKSISPTTGSWHKIKVTDWLSDGSITVSLNDGQETISGTASTLFGHNQVGLDDSGGLNCYIDNVFKESYPAEPPSLTATADDDNREINLSWSDPNSEEQFAEYNIKRDGDTIDSLSTYNQSYTDTDVSGNTTYDYEVRVYVTDDQGNALSNTETVTTGSYSPSRPSNLSTSVSSTTTVDLSWTDNSNNEDGFYVYRAESSGSSTADYTQIADLSAGTTTYSDTGNAEGERYYYRVSAYNTNGESDLSNESTQTTDLPAPSAFSAYESGNDVDLYWTDNASNEDGYRIYRDGTNIASLSSNTESYSDTGLSYDTTYNYEVEAYTSHTTASDTTSATTGSDVSAPSAPSNLSSTESAGDVDLNWDGSNWNGDQGSYEVYRGESSGSISNNIASISAGTTSYTDTSVSDGEKYYYEVEATNSAGTSPRSNTTSEVLSLPAPSGTSANAAGTSQIDLSWTDNSDNEDGFEVFRGTSSGSLNSVTTVGSNVTSYSDTGLSSDTTYYCRVESYTEHTTSSGSEASATTDPDITAPTGVTITDTSTADELTLDWTEDDNAAGYYVYRAESSGSTKSDYTQIADVTTPPYTDTSLEDGEKFYYRVSSHD